MAIKIPTVSSDPADAESAGAAMECPAKLERKKAVAERKLMTCILAVVDDKSFVLSLNGCRCLLNEKCCY